ncbi:21018_t:CDS:2, partial [Rhizophagus irregularis]
MENQASLVNTEATTTDEINTDPISNTQNIDIYEVQLGRNKALKLLALHILKHLPDDILREELDVSSIKSNEAIPDYGPCMECDIPILTEDPPRSLVLNVCGDMIHRTCAEKIHKDGTLLCSCRKADHSDPLLPFQYSIVDYGGREKSSISNSCIKGCISISGAFILAFYSDKTGLLGIGCELVDDSNEGISEVPDILTVDTITSVNSSGIGSSGNGVSISSSTDGFSCCVTIGSANKLAEGAEAKLDELLLKELSFA